MDVVAHWFVYLVIVLLLAAIGATGYITHRMNAAADRAREERLRDAVKLKSALGYGLGRSRMGPPPPIPPAVHQPVYHQKPKPRPTPPGSGSASIISTKTRPKDGVIRFQCNVCDKWITIKKNGTLRSHLEHRNGGWECKGTGTYQYTYMINEDPF